ncbi:hypothetical protein P3T76_004645 [Phytophthora citrophthora]|uniref:Uncharacterized protein n=1 Tax=Phytophthora citrophthora TaxID=4793 RepID=A0AAD9GRI4_9STRA|nr:hypothetical protein P3T76_004645 [Phytophthora citrophthora]
MVENTLQATLLYEPPSKHIDKDKFAAVDLYFPILAKAYGELSFGKEAKRLHFIVPVLAIVCALFEDVKILSEKTIEGKRVHEHGAFEFVIKRGNTRVRV